MFLSSIGNKLNFLHVWFRKLSQEASYSATLNKHFNVNRILAFIYYLSLNLYKIDANRFFFFFFSEKDFSNIKFQ